MSSKKRKDIAVSNNNQARVADLRTTNTMSRAKGPMPFVAFIIFSLTHIFAAFASPIQDCDEVYNYWEPTHYLNHGSGMQTWEYSPEYSIRSWAYAGLHAALIKMIQFLPFVDSTHKVIEFYSLRIALGLLCAICETRLYARLRRLVNGRIATLWLIVMVTSPGMLHASVAYLPSSFAMYGFMLGLSAFVDWRNGQGTAQGIMWISVGGLFGWPFALALMLPFLLEEALLLLTYGDLAGPISRVLDGALRAFILAGFQFLVDSWFYRKWTWVPFNIVSYNIFSGSERGPNIYGTEPWHFYVRNLILNFHLWFILACASFPLLAYGHLLRGQPVSRQSLLRSTVFLAPFYMWLAIFTVQPHKEERFMYPIYPAISLGAAYSSHILLSMLNSPEPRSLLGKIPTKIKTMAAAVVLLLAVNVGMLRAIGVITAYSAPLHALAPLREPRHAISGGNVCMGKEWYRFPSSYHLPVGMRAKFIKSEFSGLLPGEFSNSSEASGWFSGARIVPKGMNDRNIEDFGKYTPIEDCDYLVDSSIPSAGPSPLEPDFVHEGSTWEQIKCEPFLDVGSTGSIGRLLWLPSWLPVPTRWKRKWGEYCLLKRRAVD